MSSVHNFEVLLQGLRPTFYGHAGISERTITRLRQETSHGSASFTSPAKRYKVSRRRVLVDTFDREAIRRKIYQLYHPVVGMHPVARIKSVIASRVI